MLGGFVLTASCWYGNELGATCWRTASAGQRLRLDMKLVKLQVNAEARKLKRTGRAMATEMEVGEFLSANLEMEDLEPRPVQTTTLLS